MSKRNSEILKYCERAFWKTIKLTLTLTLTLTQPSGAELSNVCWAFATLGYEADTLFEAVANEHSRVIRDGKEQVSERNTDTDTASEPFGRRGYEPLNKLTIYAYIIPHNFDFV